MRPISQSAEFLKNVTLFAELSPDNLAKLSLCLTTCEFPSGEVIIREGAPGVSMYIVQAGLLEVRKKDPETGSDFFLRHLGPGASFGETSLLTGKPRPETVMTVETTVCLALRVADFKNLILQHPEISRGLASSLAKRLEEANTQIGVRYINLSSRSWDAKVVGLLPREFIQTHKVVPVAFINNTLTLAMVNPSNRTALNDARRYLNGVIEPHLCAEEDFRRFMDTIYPGLMGIAEHKTEVERGFRPAANSLEDLQNEILSGIEVQNDEEERPTAIELVTAPEDAPIVRVANNILALAVKKGASDIHLEPQEGAFVLRFRIDGILRIESILSKQLQAPLTSRFKILSKLDISERRLPQDGRISIRIDDRRIDFRVTTSPTYYGEKITMTVTDKTGSILPLDKLVIHDPTLRSLHWMINQPYGVVYVTGLSGSGKTTTLYSILNEINSSEISISSAEDPIEHNLAGINQTQTQKDIGLDFARLVRSFLRQDVDVIVAGEIRDQETAKLIVEAALTGTLLFAGLHARDAAEAFVRLREMGIDPFPLAKSTIGVVSQRLVRKLCANCKVTANIDDETLAFLGCSANNAPAFYRAEGCDRCNYTGKRGRIGIYEVLVMTDELSRVVASGADPDVIREHAVKNGMVTLRDYAMILLSSGLTSVDEVLGAIVPTFH